MYIQYIYSTRTPLDYYLFAHCFVKGLHLFLILWYFWLIGILEKQWQQQQKNKTIFDGPSGRMSVCQEGIPLFEGAEHELEA